MVCKNCRKRKRNVDSSPKRPERGSIRKRKRDEMRRKKKLTMQKSKERSEELSGGKTICQSIVSII